CSRFCLYIGQGNGFHNSSCGDLGHRLCVCHVVGGEDHRQGNWKRDFPVDHDRDHCHHATILCSGICVKDHQQYRGNHVHVDRTDHLVPGHLGFRTLG